MDSIEPAVRRHFKGGQHHMEFIESGKLLKAVKVVWQDGVGERIEAHFTIEERPNAPFTLMVVPDVIVYKTFDNRTMKWKDVALTSRVIGNLHKEAFMTVKGIPVDLCIEILKKATEIAYSELGAATYGYEEWYPSYDEVDNKIEIKFEFPPANQPQKDQPSILDKIPKHIIEKHILEGLPIADQKRFSHVMDALKLLPPVITREVFEKYIAAFLRLLYMLPRDIDAHIHQIDFFFGDSANTFKLVMQYERVTKYWDESGDKQYDEIKMDYIHEFTYTMKDRMVEVALNMPARYEYPDHVVQPVLTLLNGKANGLLYTILTTIDTTKENKRAHIGSIGRSIGSIAIPQYLINDKLVLKQLGGKRKAAAGTKTKTSEKASYHGRHYVVYLGPRNGRYIRVKGMFRLLP